MQRYTALQEKLDRGETVVLDGPMGSELVRRGVRWRQHGLRHDADAVQALHVEYLQAGADVLRTNTFQLNRRIYQDVFRDLDHMRHIGAPGLERRVPQLLPRAVELAQAARTQAGREDVPIAGVMSPLEHCFRPDLAPSARQARTEHTEIAGLLAGADVDFLLLESMNTLAEARVAVEAARETGLPMWCSFVTLDGALLSGESLAEAVTTMRNSRVDKVLVNCLPPDDVGRALSSGVDGAYAHVGKFDPPSWKFEFFPQFSGTEAWPAERYAEVVQTWDVRIVGGCCGTGPAHVQALKQALAA
jgi:S-methylmethionine-dependent homocysteine/selenocysteine methylase